MIRKEKNGIVWLEFELLAEFKNLQHGVFLRHGGVSSGRFGSLNFALMGGDVIANVKMNRQRVQEILQLPRMARSHLQHGCQAAVVDLNNIDAIHFCDALATREKNIGLLITHADCQAAVFYDPVENIVANVHAGWRGNVLNVYGKTIDFLKHHFGCNPANLCVGISPSLGPDDAEFINYQTEFPTSFQAFQTKQNHFNLWEISRWQLQREGILPHHIQIAEISTLSNPQDYFSYRREPISGRHGTIAFLSEYIP